MSCMHAVYDTPGEASGQHTFLHLLLLFFMLFLSSFLYQTRSDAEREKINILFIACESELSSQYNSVRSSAFIKVATVRQTLRGSILTSLWSYPYSPWALWISLLKAFLIHLGNNWDQLEAALSGLTCIWKSRRCSTPIQSYNIPWQAVLKLHWQAEEDGFEGYRSSAEKPNHDVEQLWLAIRYMLWVMGWSVSKLLFYYPRMGMGVLYIWYSITHNNQRLPRSGFYI